MKQIVTNILLVVVSGLILYSLLLTTTIKTDIGTHNKKINKIENRIDSAILVNKELDKKIAEIDSNIFVISEGLKSVEKNINLIKKRTNERVNGVDNYNNTQLEEFFSKRYNPDNH